MREARHQGLRVITEVVPSVRSVALGLWVRTGSRDEQPARAGVSHFLEHLLFKGTERHSAIEISELFDGMGAATNAATSKESTHLNARLLDEHTDGEAAAILTARGLVSGTGKLFSGDRVATIRRAYRLKDRGTRLREAGMLSLDEVAEKLGVNTWVIKSRRLRGQLPIGSHRLDDQGQYMYERPAPGASLHCRRSPVRADQAQNA